MFYQATKHKKYLDINLKVKIDKVISHVKRGCSLGFIKMSLEFLNINGNDNKIMDYPIKWRNEEIQFDQKISYVNKMMAIYQGVSLELLYNSKVD